MQFLFFFRVPYFWSYYIHLSQRFRRDISVPGCNDAFSAFAFLAFLLALLQLIMNMQGGGAPPPGRRRRSVTPDVEETKHQMRNDPVLREATLG